MTHTNDTIGPTYRRPLPSRASRTPSARSRRSSRGHVPSKTEHDERPRVRHFESKREQEVLHLLLARRDVVDVFDQPPAISYVDSDGRRRTHTFDFLAVHRDGRRIAVAVKAAAIAARSNFRETLRLIRAATPLSFADQVVLVTEQSYTPAAARNAQKLHDFRRTPDREADDRVIELIDCLTGSTRVAQLVEQASLGGRGFRAVFRAIFAGQLQTLSTGDILPSTFVIREVSK